jgi:hypothetical protein
MAEKFDLKKMLEEIKEDETQGNKDRLKLSKDGLKKLVAERKKARKGANGES